MNQVEVIEPTRIRGQQNFNQNQKRKVAAYEYAIISIT